MQKLNKYLSKGQSSELQINSNVHYKITEKGFKICISLLPKVEGDNLPIDNMAEGAAVGGINPRVFTGGLA